MIFSAAATIRSSLRLSATATSRFMCSVQPEKIEYVHPLSQLVLEHLQTTRSEWVQRMGLDKGLTLNSDGTFLLTFPSNQGDRIWTYFDSNEKKHWLMVKKGELVGQFLLQDNLKHAWNDGRSTPEKVQKAVDDLIGRMEQE